MEFEQFKKEEIWVFHLTYYFFWFFYLEQVKAGQLTWGCGFIGGPITTEKDPDSEDPDNSNYHSAVTEVISDSEDDLFFLDGELATTCHCI